MAKETLSSEEDVIAAFWAPLAQGFAGAFGLRDDCAVIEQPQGCDLVVTTDAIVEGVHVLPGTDPGAVAWKALAVNVSDLIAKGAQPFAYLMSLALPEAPSRDFLAAFSGGLARAQATFGCQLIGGDTDRTLGPLSVSITAFGALEHGSFVQRAGAKPGDHVFVSGTIGDAALGLALARGPAQAHAWGFDAAAAGFVRSRFDTPLPPLALAPIIRSHARASMDISDGLVKDFERLCRVSGVGGRLIASQVPLSAPARAVVERCDVPLEVLLTGGEDYEALCVVPGDRATNFASEAAAAGIAVTAIGEILEASAGCEVLGTQGVPLTFKVSGWDHLREASRS
jgi:thiamine-monophosphate kinase